MPRNREVGLYEVPSLQSAFVIFAKSGELKHVQRIHGERINDRNKIGHVRFEDNRTMDDICTEYRRKYPLPPKAILSYYGNMPMLQYNIEQRSFHEKAILAEFA